MEIRQIKTTRTLLRSWRQRDLISFRILNADPDVMRFFPHTLSEEESDRFADAIQERMHTSGFGLWALELPGITEFAGFVGLNVPRTIPALSDRIEIGWRLHKQFWKHGFASEAAAAVLEAAFTLLDQDEICSFTSILNRPSQKVMQRLGMQLDFRSEFYHPALPQSHPLCRHVLYQMTKELWIVQRKNFAFLENLHIMTA